MKTETPREMITRLLPALERQQPSRFRDVVDAIEAALNAERERAAKIAETHERTHGNMHFGYCGPAIAGAIRSTNEN